MAKEHQVSIGAHTGFPDLMGFGRRNLAVSPAEAKAYTLYQISALGGMCKAHNMRLQHVKPHGALYNMAAKDYELSKAICEAIKSYDPEIIVMGLSGSEMIRAAKDLGLKAASEVFADRAYEEDGTLVNRRKEGAVIKDENEAIARVIRMIKSRKLQQSPEKIFPFRLIPYAFTVMAKKLFFSLRKSEKLWQKKVLRSAH